VLSLFANLFGRADDGDEALPATLLKQLTERAVDGTDPRVRMISSYAKTLKKPVSHAAEYLIAMIDNLPAPLELIPAALRDTPALAAFLYSAEEAKQLLARDAALLEFRTTHPATVQQITALLVVQQSEKRSFGVGQVGEQTVQDVPRTTVSFSDHRLLEPAVDETGTRTGLKRRAFDQLLAVALAMISERKEERAELNSMQALLRSKLQILQRSGSFAQHAGQDERAQLQARMAEIEQKLVALGPSTDALQGNLDVIAQVLSEAERHLWIEERTLNLDQFYVLHDKPVPSALAVVCRDIHNSAGQQLTLQMVKLQAG
jgi:hypothetical protein